MAPSHTLTSHDIKALARARGFPLAGVIPVGPNRTHGFYTDWLKAGFAGNMSYLERHALLKTHPAQVEPDARTLVVVAHPYGGSENGGSEAESSTEAGAEKRLRGRISRYATGLDYHDVIRERLAGLAADLEALHLETFGHESPSGAPLHVRSFVDTAPLMEREHAARAGLGWVGRNAMLIHWKLGSYMFLGGLLLNLALPEEEYDSPPPAGRHPRAPQFSGAEPISRGGSSPLPAPVPLPWQESCGTCTACMEACPTGAIVADKTVDARRCISYLTIELKGPIPHDLRPGLGDWVFGCDICQEVCPWNRKAARDPNVAAQEAEYWPRAGASRPDLVELLAMDGPEFKRRFKDTPLWRTKRRGLLRNAALVLGNLAAGEDGMRAAEALPALRKALVDAEPLVRGAAAWALGRMGGAAPRQALEAHLSVEADDEVRGEMIAALKG